MTAKQLDLTKASRKELVDRYRKLVEESIYHGDFAFERQEVRDELRHREIRSYTKAMFWMTIAITLATIANVIMWALR